MPFERPPDGLGVEATPDSVSIAIHPFLPEIGRNDLRILRAARYVGRYVVVIGGLIGLVFGVVPRLIALAVLVGALVWITVAAIRDARRQRSQLVLRVTRDDVRVTVTTDGKVDRDDRAMIRDIGRVDVIEAGYQRWHVVANVVGRDALVVEMERHTAEAAQWVARELAAAGKGARDRNGGGEREIPDPLRRLTRSQSIS